MNQRPNHSRLSRACSRLPEDACVAPNELTRRPLHLIFHIPRCAGQTVHHHLTQYWFTRCAASGASYALPAQTHGRFELLIAGVPPRPPKDLIELVVPPDGGNHRGGEAASTAHRPAWTCPRATHKAAQRGFGSLIDRHERFRCSQNFVWQGGVALALNTATRSSLSEQRARQAQRGWRSISTFA
jgi:hypothetical protein